MSWFGRMSAKAAHWVGHPLAFSAAVALLLLWAITGPLFRFSNTWQLVINTTTTIVTFLMVFIIQNTQNRDAEATQSKLDELLRAVSTAQTAMAGVEDKPEAEMRRLRQHYLRLAHNAKGGQVEVEDDRSGGNAGE